MNIKLQLTETVSPEIIEQAANVASLGFEQEGNPAMVEDTYNHIASAEQMHLAYTAEELVGFSLYRSSLWRQGY